MKKYNALLLTLLLGVATVPPAYAQSQNASQMAQATIDSSLTGNKVTFAMTGGAPLSSLLTALAKAAGYGLIFDGNVDVKDDPKSSAGSAYSFKNKPFNEVWPLIMDVHGLSYSVVNVGGQPILRVSNKPVQEVVKLKHVSSDYAYEKALRFFGEPLFSETSQKDADGNIIGSKREIIGYKIQSSTLKLVPDQDNDSLIIGGSTSELMSIRKFIKSIDLAKNSDASAKMAATEAQKMQQHVYTVKGMQKDIEALLAAQYPKLKVTAVGSTGQLVLNGTKAQIDAALTLLKQVDREKPVIMADSTVQKIFQLVNASAEEVKATLEGTLAREVNEKPVAVATPTKGETDGKTTTQPVTTSQPAATIIADKRTNSVIVRGSPSQVEQISMLIPKLDQVVPQINVQVRIQEISKTGLNSLGMNWKAAFGGFNVAIGGESGLSASFDPTRTLMGFNVFPTLTALEKQNMTQRVYDGNVTMQSGQRSLDTASGTANASNKAAASIKSGGRLEVTIPSDAGNIQKQIDYGVNLDFYNPQVAPDGTITLRVRGQVNALKTSIDAKTIPNLLDFSNSEAQSTITFKDGQTVLMSGLLGTTTTSDKTGVPGLSSIPIIGSAFGKQTKNKTESQLLVVITGTVIK